MNSLAVEFFEGGGEVRFDQALLLERAGWDWERACREAEGLPRGWFELSRIGQEHRVEFVREFWTALLPYHPAASVKIDEFFGRVGEIDVVLRRQNGEEPLVAELVYSLRDNSSFFRGLAPASEGEEEEARRQLGVLLPRDFRAFCKIHNGFGKLSELGVMRLEEMGGARREIEMAVWGAAEPLYSGPERIDPSSLIPFYHSFGLASYQCFYRDWYPGSEMGNLYFSGIDYTISNVSDRKRWSEELAFPTFIEWLAAFLTGMNVSP
jgi:hypothetical protein